jgi:3-isopropylmalate/(R)-2-methylmalate dehydratase large subunit
MNSEGRRVRCPEQVFAFHDHYVPTTGRERGIEAIVVPEIRQMVTQLQENAREHGFTLFGLDDPRQGILHVVPPELGLTLPGLVIVGSDSHTCTHGAFGTLAFGIGASEMMHVLATQTIWQRQPRTMRIIVNGELGFGVCAKDVILAIIGAIGVAGASGCAIEYSGAAISAMSMEARMTLCNMSIEAGARTGMVAPDETTWVHLAGKPYAPQGTAWDGALSYWRTLASDADARFDSVVAIDGCAIAPMVTWGTTPEQAAPVTGRVPRLSEARNERERGEFAAALEYMDLQPGMPLADISVDRVFIGTCTNGRIEDLRAAAQVARLGRARIPAWVVPGSREVQREAEREGLDQVFAAAGFEWRDPGCSMCTGHNGDQLRPGERCASTSNRNFVGRQGRGSRTHLVSPAMAAAAALTGRLVDVRELLGRG